jgi:hypothetical protein
MKLQPETLSYLKTLTVEQRKEFLAYLKDADDNVVAEVSHLDNEMGFVHVDNPNESE